jgi:hypothetical protein
MEEVPGGENIVEKLTQNKEFAILLKEFDPFLKEFTVEKKGPQNTWFEKAIQQRKFWDEHNPQKEKMQTLNERARVILGKGNDWNFLTAENFPHFVEAVHKASSPASAAQPALSVVPKTPNLKFNESLADGDTVKKINEEIKKLGLGYTLKKDDPNNYHLDGPIKILIPSNGQMVAVNEDRNHKDYATHVANAMHAICIMNFHLGYTFAHFDWHEQIPEAKKAEFDATKADLQITFSKEKEDAGNVHISSGPTLEARKSDYNIDTVLKKPGVVEAIQKAVGTMGYLFDKDKNTMTRTWSNEKTRTLTVEKDGSITAPAFSLGTRFKEPLANDERSESRIEKELLKDFTAMARFYVTAFIKGGAEALPETLDFRLDIKGSTSQKRHLTEISKRVYEGLKEEFQRKPFANEKGYYPQEFLDRILFNGAKTNLKAVDSPKHAAPGSPDEEPPAKRLNMGKTK